MIKSTEQTYGLVARALHWSIAVLIILMIASGYAAGEVLPKAVVIPLHKSTGIIVLGLSIIRLAWWAMDCVRPGDAELTWEKWPSRLAKWALAGLALAVPVSGWLMSSAADKAITLYGLATVPMLLAPDKELAHTLGEVHETLGSIIAIILAVHVVGALRHHYVLKDQILSRMLGR